MLLPEAVDDYVGPDNVVRFIDALGYLSPTEFLMKTTAPALETLAGSTLPQLN